MSLGNLKDNHIKLTDYIARLSISNTYSLLIPTGTIVPFAVTTPPVGYLLCDGSAVSRITYAALFNVIGATFGVGDGETTFNVPNMIDKIPIGSGNLYSLGQIGGVANQTLTVGQMPSHNHGGITSNSGGHTHTAIDSGHNHGMKHCYDDKNFSSSPGQERVGDADPGGSHEVNGAPTQTATANITVAGVGDHNHTITLQGGSSFSILPPHVALLHIIKY